MISFQIIQYDNLGSSARQQFVLQLELPRFLYLAASSVSHNKEASSIKQRHSISAHSHATIKWTNKEDVESQESQPEERTGIYSLRRLLRQTSLLHNYLTVQCKVKETARLSTQGRVAAASNGNKLSLRFTIELKIVVVAMKRRPTERHWLEVTIYTNYTQITRVVNNNRNIK